MNCRDCRHCYLKRGAESMARLGFRNCRHLPDYHFVSGGNKCRIGLFLKVIA